MKTRLNRLIPFFVVFFLFVFLQANASTFTVTNTNDAGAGSLRQAILDANANAGADIIDATGISGTISLLSVLPNITESVTITGPGMTLLTINQTIDRRVFTTGTGAINFVLQDITLNFAGPGTTPYSGGGGAILAGGAGASTELTNVTISNFNQQIGNGGAISQSSSLNSHSLTITNCIFTNNKCGGAGGAISFNSQGGTATITGCTFSGNQTGPVGLNTGGDGGAINLSGGGSGGTYLIEKNTFLNNQVENVTGHAGAIMSTNGTATIRYNRFIGNTCANVANPPLANIVGQAGGATTHITIADNNWWGVNTGPGANDATALASGAVMILTKWLQLKTTASTNPICASSPSTLGHTSTVTTSFLSNSASEAIAIANLTSLIGLPVVWGPTTLGSFSGEQGTIQANGTATALFTSNGTGGTATVNTQVDNVPANETSPARASITVNDLSTPPTGANGTTIDSGTSASLEVLGGMKGAGAITEWFSDSCGGTLEFTGDTFITPTLTAETTYYVRYNGTCNTTECATVTVNINNNCKFADAYAAGANAYIDLANDGFGPWNLVDTNAGDSGQSGFFVATSTENGDGDSNFDDDIDSAGVAFGLYANSGQQTDAIRDFDTPMETGDSFSIDMDNGWVEAGGVVGLSLQNASGNNLIEFYFSNGSSNYSLNDAGGVFDTGIPFTDEGLSLSFEVTATGKVDVEVIDLATGTVSNFSRSLLNPGDQVISRIRMFNFNAGLDAPRNVYFNTLQHCIDTSVDSTPPDITCPHLTGTTVNADENCQSILIDYTGDATVSDDKSETQNITVTQSPLPGAVLSLGENQITLTATDEAGNSTECSFMVTVNDTEAPTAVCQNVEIKLSEGNTITASQVNNGSSDNCTASENLILSIDRDTFGCEDVGATYSTGAKLILTGVIDGPLSGGIPKAVEVYALADITNLSIYGIGVANNAGGTDGQEFTFPAVSVSAGTYLYIATETTAFTSFFGFAPNYTDGDMAVNGDDAIELFENGEVIDVFGDISGLPTTWNYMDGWVYRNDNTSPDGSTFQLSNWSFSGINALDGETTNAGASTPFPIGTYVGTVPTEIPGVLVTLTVEDASGNKSTCTATITVIDDVAPEITCPTPNNFYPVDSGLCSASLSFEAEVSDNCGVASTVYSIEGSEISFPYDFPEGITTVDVLVTDIHDNINTCSFEVVVNDMENPVAVCKDITVELDENGEATIVASDIDGGSSDNCEIDTIVASRTTFDCSDVSIGGSTPIGKVVISQVYGGGGNAGATYTNDFIELFNAGNTTVSLTGWSVQYTSATGTGNFGGNSTLITELPNISLVPGQYLLIQEASGGSVGTALPTPDVTDVTPINMSATGGKVALVNTTTPLGCNGSSTLCDAAALATIVDLVGWGTANFFEGSAAPATSNTTSVLRASNGCEDSDNNSVDFTTGSPAPRNSATTLSPCSSGSSGIPVTLTVTDIHGNVDTCTAYVTVVDNSDPTITCVDDQTKSTDEGECYYTVSGTEFDPTFGDNCSGSTISNDYNNLETLDGATFPFGTTTVVWTVTDASNKTSTCSFDVIVNKVTPKITVSVAPDEQQYSDLVTFTATVLPVEDCAGAGTICGLVTFKVNGQTMGTAPVINGVATLANIPLIELPLGTYPGNGSMDPAGTETVEAILAACGDYVEASDASTDALDITCEDASIVNTGNSYFTANPNNGEGTVALSAFVVDDADGNRGDIRNATVTFHNDDITGTALGTPNIPVGLIDPNIKTDGFVTTDLNYGLNTNEQTGGGKVWTVFTTVNNYYCGATDEATVVTLAMPGADYVTGGGHILQTNTSGQYPGINNTGKKMNFGFVMKWNKSGKNLQGNVNIIYRGPDGNNYQIKSNAINSLAVKAITGFNTATITTKANLKRIFPDGTFESIAGNLSLVVTAYESTTDITGKSDKISVQLAGDKGSGIYFSSNWSSGKTQLQQLNGGKIQIRNANSSSSKTTSTATASTSVSGTFELEAWPNPSKNEFNIKLNSANKIDKVEIHVYDINGREVYYNAGKAGEEYRFGRTFESGMYFVNITQANESRQVKLIKY